MPATSRLKFFLFRNLTTQIVVCFHSRMSTRAKKFEFSNFANLSGSARTIMTAIKMR